MVSAAKFHADFLAIMTQGKVRTSPVDLLPLFKEPAKNSRVVDIEDIVAAEMTDG